MSTSQYVYTAMLTHGCMSQITVDCIQHALAAAVPHVQQQLAHRNRDYRRHPSCPAWSNQKQSVTSVAAVNHAFQCNCQLWCQLPFAVVEMGTFTAYVHHKWTGHSMKIVTLRGSAYAPPLHRSGMTYHFVYAFGQTVFDLTEHVATVTQKARESAQLPSGGS